MAEDNADIREVYTLIQASEERTGAKIDNLGDKIDANLNALSADHVLLKSVQAQHVNTIADHESRIRGVEKTVDTLSTVADTSSRYRTAAWSLVIGLCGSLGTYLVLYMFHIK